MKQALVYTIFAGVFLIPFIPFIIAPSLLFPFITGKAFAFRIIVEVIFVAWLILALKDANYRPKPSWILTIFSIFLVVVAFSDALGVNPYKAFWSNYERMEGLVTILHLFAFFVVLSAFLNKEKLWRGLFATHVGASVIMGIYGLFQLAGKLTINQGGVRVDGTLGNATYLAVYLMMNFFFVLYLFVQGGEYKKKLWWFAPIAILQLYILYHTATRGAILGLLGGLVVATVLLVWRERENRLVKRSALTVLISVLVVIGGFYLVRNSDFVKESQVLARFRLSPSEIKSQGRYYIWPMAWQGIKEKPILGWGQEGFSYVFNKYYDSRLYAHEQWFDRAHSTPIDWFIAGGIFALLSYLGLFFFALYYLWKRDKGMEFKEKSILTGILAAYFFQNIFVFDNLASYILFFTVIAYVHFRSTTERSALLSSVSFSVAWRAIIVSTLIIIFSGVVYFANIKPIQAGRSLISALRTVQEGQANAAENSLALFKKALAYESLGTTEIREQLVNSAESFLQESVPEAVRREYLELTVSELDKQVNETPNDTRYFVFQGLFLARLGLFDQALAAYDRAHQLSPGKQTVLFDAASIYIARQEFETALNILKTAFELEPSYNGARILYAVAAIHAGNFSLADEILSYKGATEEQMMGFQNALIFDGRLLEAWVKAGRFDRAIPILVLRIEREPQNENHFLSLAAAYLEIGERQRSVEVLKVLKERIPAKQEEVDFYINEIEAGRNP
jgi:O-antigen ligase/thioredoxin-like negative regulator of GroEL